MQVFSNNARTTLAQPLSAGGWVGGEWTQPDDTMVAVDDGSANTFAQIYSEGEDVQMATLTHESMPDVLEIVEIRMRPGTNVFNVTRGVESPGDTARDWPAGTVVEGRVTAGMLSKFAQEDFNNKAVRADQNDIIHMQNRSVLWNCRRNTGGILTDRVQISGWPVLQKRSRDGSGWGYQDADQVTQQVMGRTLQVSLGQVPSWSAGYYKDGAVVRPTVANGYQYVFDYWDGQYPNQMFSQEPDFARAGGHPLNIAGGDGYPEDVVRGSWIPSPDPLDVAFRVTGGSADGIYFMPTEVGFVCTKFEGATPPSVSIGTPADPTCFVNDQGMSQIAGARQCQRWPVAAGGALVQSLQFKLETAATGVFEGFFFWRGAFMDLAE